MLLLIPDQLTETTAPPSAVHCGILNIQNMRAEMLKVTEVIVKMLL